MTPRINLNPSECLICGSPLGQESKDLGFWTCSSHRACSKCGQPVPPPEIQWSFNKFIEDSGDETCDVKHAEIQHSKCASLSTPSLESDPTLSIKQSHFDYINLVRLMIEPDPNLSIETNQSNAGIHSTRYVHQLPDFESREIFLRKIEAIAAQVSLLLKRDPKYNKSAIQEREKKRALQAKREAETSSRPAGVKPEDPTEEMLSEFMKNFGFKSRKFAQRAQKTRDKAVQDLCAAGVPSLLAKQQVDKMLHDNIAKGRVELEDPKN